MDSIPKKLEPSRNQVRAARAFFGMTQANWAKLIGIYQSTLLDYENGNRKPGPGTAERIGLGMTRLGVRFDDDGNMILPPEPPAETATA